MTTSKRLPTLFIPHGGDPCFFMKPEDLPPGMPKKFWAPMASYLQGIDAMIGRQPKAVVVATAHWLAPQVTIGSANTHQLYYDYYGFPKYTYELDYPARGAPDVASRVEALLGAAGIPSLTDDKRGIDHGVFVPFKLIYPDADVPIVPLSLQQNLNAAAHLAIGAALEPLRDEDVLIVGSGMSFHNLHAMRGQALLVEAAAFDDWLTEAVTARDPQIRTRALKSWNLAAHARVAHPEEEHLIPLMIAAGAAGLDEGRKTYAEQLGTSAMSAFTFG